MIKTWIEKLKALRIYAVMYWFKKLFKKEQKNIQINLIVGQTDKGPKSQPIIFESMKDGFEYFKHNS
jgi:hypothetical protein